jgi:hypothetical protein
METAKTSVYMQGENLLTKGIFTYANRTLNYAVTFRKLSENANTLYFETVKLE